MAITEIVTSLVQFITSIISNLGYGGIFFLMILESALIPIPSEVIMPFSGFLVSVGKLGSVGVGTSRFIWKPSRFHCYVLSWCTCWKSCNYQVR